MKLSQIKKLILDNIAFEDMEDGKTINWMDIKFRSGLKSARNIWDIINTFRDVGMDYEDCAETLLEVLRDDRVMFREESDKNK